MGAPSKEIRLMVGLQYLKYMYNESNEMIVRKFVENPYFQYFCANEYFESSLPINSSSMTRFSKRMGKESIDELLKEIVKSANRSKQLQEKDFDQLNLDMTVQEKAISFQTDANLYYKMLKSLVKGASRGGIKLKAELQVCIEENIEKTSRLCSSKTDEAGKQNDKENKDIFRQSISRDNEK